MRKLTLLAATAMALIALGCASFNARVFQAESLAANMALGGVKAYKIYHQNATNGAPQDVRAEYDKRFIQVKETTQKLGAVLNTVDQLRREYAANSAETNKAALELALQTLTNQSSNLVELVQYLMRDTKPIQP